MALPGALKSTDCTSLEVVANMKLACAAIMSAVAGAVPVVEAAGRRGHGILGERHEVLAADHGSGSGRAERCRARSPFHCRSRRR